jgi:hypothetical protein
MAQPQPAQKLAGDLGGTAALTFDGVVHAPHRVVIDTPGEQEQRRLGERHAREEIGARQWRGFVRWKERAVVAQCQQVERDDLGIGQ